MVVRKRNATTGGGGAGDSTSSSSTTPRTTRAASTRSQSAAATTATPSGSRGGGGRKKAGGRGAPGPPVVPDVYRELLVEARAEARSAQAQDNSGGLEQRPLKRKRPGEKGVPSRQKEALVLSKPEEAGQNADDSDDDDDDVEFEDVIIPAPTVQTMVRESDDDDDDVVFEDVDVDPGGLLSASAAAGEGQSKDMVLDLNLSAQRNAMTESRRAADRRKPVTREEKERRVQIHKMHLLCLLSHVERRNRWCNDTAVQEAIRPLLTDKMLKSLIPRASLTQFGRTESLKCGVQETSSMFLARFRVTERGLWRALWAEDEEQLKNYKLPEDIDSTLEKSDFLEAAKALKGSRDVGAQLFCALLRCAGVEARLVCSLQPLACVAGGPLMPKQRGNSGALPPKPSKADIYAASMEKHQSKAPVTASPRRRLGHPLAAGYHVPSMTPPPPATPRAPTQSIKPIRGESSFPVYWVEVLDVAHQKWHPVDPLVTCTQWKPRVLEPPASDPKNCLTYVVAFDADGSAKDVTRRYAKAYNSKTRKMRVDGAMVANRTGPEVGLTGERWWRRTMRTYARPWPTDLDQIERNELAAEEAKEPMPRNVADFKDHPVYALERHLRQNEVLIPGAQATGTVGAGSKGPLERIYRRRDVQIARTRDKWYRMGREVKPGAEPVKILPKRQRKRGRFDDTDDDEEDDDPDKVGLFGDAVAGVPVYTVDQTDLYQAPPVVNGRVPKNKFGNLDVYVPSMVPAGGAYIVHDRAAQAAFILGVDYAPALTGFSFKGRHGTAVLNGVVVPQESEEAVRAVITGLADLDAEMERERRSRKALRMWSWFLKALRIRERIWAGADPDEEARDDDDKGKAPAVDDDEEEDVEMADAMMSDVSEEFEMGDDDGGGGFFAD